MLSLKVKVLLARREERLPASLWLEKGKNGSGKVQPICRRIRGRAGLVIDTALGDFDVTMVNLGKLLALGPHAICRQEKVNA